MIAFRLMAKSNKGKENAAVWRTFSFPVYLQNLQELLIGTYLLELID